MLAAATATSPAFEPRPYPYYPHPAIHGFNLPANMYVNPTSPPDQHEALLGRKLSPTPARLGRRVLYVPPHDDAVTHLPIYDFTREYRRAVRDEPIGSSRFKTSFGLMPKPTGDGRGDVSYLVDFDPPEARASPMSSPSSSRRKARRASGAAPTHATVRRRMLYGGAEVGLTMPARRGGDDEKVEGASACTVTPASTGAPVNVATSHPLPATVSRWGSSRNPWFTYTVPSLLDEEHTLQWQVHPVEHGMLRYTLVEIPADGCVPEAEEDKWWETDKEDEKFSSRRRNASKQDSGSEKPPFSACEAQNEPLVRAIYHGVGLGFSLSQPRSEGALLLQDDLSPEAEAVVVASLLGLLWAVRGEDSRPGKKSARSSAGSSDGGSVGMLAPGRRKSKSPSVSSAEGESEKRGGSRSPSPGRKGLIGKILRRMS